MLGFLAFLLRDPGFALSRAKAAPRPSRTKTPISGQWVPLLFPFSRHHNETRAQDDSGVCMGALDAVVCIACHLRVGRGINETGLLHSGGQTPPRPAVCLLASPQTIETQTHSRCSDPPKTQKRRPSLVFDFLSTQLDGPLTPITSSSAIRHAQPLQSPPLSIQNENLSLNPDLHHHHHLLLLVVRAVFGADSAVCSFARPKHPGFQPFASPVSHTHPLLPLGSCHVLYPRAPLLRSPSPLPPF